MSLYSVVTPTNVMVTSNFMLRADRVAGMFQPISKSFTRLPTCPWSYFRYSARVRYIGMPSVSGLYTDEGRSA